MSSRSFKYGSKAFELEIPKGQIIHTLLPQPVEPVTDIKQELLYRLQNPLGTPPLDELAAAGDRICIVVSDVTRLWIKTDSFLLYIVDYLNNLGIKDEDIFVLIALGTHRPSTEEEKKLIVGAEVYHRLQVLDHDCSDEKELIYLGCSSRGTPIYINKKALEAHKLIITGGIAFHLFAGFGGGAKSVVPGIAGLQTIQHNHRLTFYEGENTGLNPAAGTNRITGNPMREDITEICRKVKPDFLINGVLDENGQFVGFVAGDFEEAWLCGCKMIRRMYGIEIAEKADIIIASAGGYPKDINLYQTVKAMDNCLYGGKENSVIVLLAECREGLGADEFMSWFQYETLSEMEAALKKYFTVPGYAAYKTAYTANHRKLILVSSLPEDTVRQLGFIPASSPEEALALAYSYSTPEPKLTLMPYGGNTFPLDR